MGAAYLYLEDSARYPKPDELTQIDLVDRFGAQAVMGRPTLGAGEMKGMLWADAVRRAYQSREHFRDEDGQVNWAAWAERNPEMNRLLIAAVMAVENASDE